MSSVHARSLALAVGALAAVTLLTGSSITWSEQALPRTLNPLLATTGAEIRTSELIFDRLVLPSTSPGTYHSSVLAQTDGALDFEVSDGGTAVKLRVRDGVRWHDGEPLEADDVCFSIDVLLDPSLASALADPVREAISSCEVSDDSVVVRYRRTTSSPLSVLDIPLVPRHVLDGQPISPELGFSTHPVGTGPMTAILDRRQVTLSGFPNPHHSPRIQQAIVREAGDPYVELSGIGEGASHGSIDVPVVGGGDYAAKLGELSDQRGLVEIDMHATPRVVVLSLNTTRGPLVDARVRQAVSRALDARALAIAAYGVHGETMIGPVPAALASNVPQANPQKVIALMTQAGATKQAGLWIMADGEPVTLTVGHASQSWGLLERHVSRQLRAAGFDAKVEMSARSPSAQHDVVITEWSMQATGDARPLVPRGQGSDIVLWRRRTMSVWRADVHPVHTTPGHYFTEFDRWTVVEGSAP